MTDSVPSLFDPLIIGDLTLPSRIIMAPLTRSRATPDTRVPTDIARDYYVQRASAGLILTEATSVTPQGVGYASTPGIWSDAQVDGWRKITDAVHRVGGRIFSQLWHVGRISDPLFLNGELPVAPSAIAAKGHVSLVRPQRPYVTPRALDISELPGVVAAFRKGAENAQKAGFDGVELHGANGYLLDQFLQDGSNTRTDAYGGSIENRARLMFEAVDAAVGVWGANRVGLHLAPRADAHAMGDSNLLATFTHVAQEAKKRKLAFLMAREHAADSSLGPKLRAAFGGPYIANEKFTFESGQQALREGRADAVGFGQLFIANPDLPARFRTGAPLNTPDPSTFYGGDAHGYTDYPALQQAAE